MGVSDSTTEMDYAKTGARLIELTLEAFGLYVKVVKINPLDKIYEYELEVAVGTNLDDLEKRGRDLAMALASPTGKVTWQIPIPGKPCLGLKVPKPTKEYLENWEASRTKLEEDRVRVGNSWRDKTASLFRTLGRNCYGVADWISGNPW